MEVDVEKRYRTLLTLWFAMLMNIGVFFIITLFAAPENSGEHDHAPSSLLVYAFTALGILLVAVSFAVKRKVLEQSVQKQDVGLVQIALIIAWALCEACALFGLVERFVTGNREYILLFLIAAIGTAFHFPSRLQILAASYKTPGGAAGS